MSDANMMVIWKDYVESGSVTPDHFVVKEGPSLTAADLQDGEALLELLYISVDPYMRGRMRNSKGYFVGAFVPGKPLDSGAIGQIIASKNEQLPEGSVVSGMFPWQKVQVLSKDQVAAATKLDTSLGVPLTAFMGPLGMVGMTAYGSLAKIAKPQPGEWAFVSGAAGAVGYLVGQLLKHVYGCHVVGSAGSDEKVAFLKRIGYDEAWNYKTMSTKDALAKYCPKGLDIYFDNVGGETLEAALDAMNNYGRVVACGSISQYDAAEEQRYGVKNLFHVVTKRLLFQGFIASDLKKDYGAAFMKDMPTYLKEGKVTVEEQVVEGMDKAGQAFCDMMAGKNIGKMIVKGFIVFDFTNDYGAAFMKDMPTYLKEGKVTIEEQVVEGMDKAGQAFCDMMAGKNIGKMIVKV